MQLIIHVSISYIIITNWQGQYQDRDSKSTIFVFLLNRALCGPTCIKIQIFLSWWQIKTNKLWMRNPYTRQDTDGHKNPYQSHFSFSLIGVWQKWIIFKYSTWTLLLWGTVFLSSHSHFSHGSNPTIVLVNY